MFLLDRIRGMPGAMGAWSSAALAARGCLAGMLLLAAPANADAPASRVAVLARGVNISHWLRFPPRSDDASLLGYLDDSVLAELKRAGFTYVRLPVGLEVVMQGSHIAPDKLPVIVAIIRRLQRAGLAVMTDPHPQLVENWIFGNNEQARQSLLGYWQDLAPALRALPAGLTFPEVVNEPTDDDPAHWDRVQRQILQVIRAALPQDTVILDGTDWSSLKGLLKITPVADQNVIYSFHSYEPTLLTLLGAWDRGVDQHALAARIPFPVGPGGCPDALAAIGQEHTRSVLQYWCSQPHDAATITADFQRAADWGREHGVSVALTEFGAMGMLNRPARNAYFAAVAHAAEALHLPWSVWALDDQLGFGRPVGPSAAAMPLPREMLTDLGVGR